MPEVRRRTRTSGKGKSPFSSSKGFVHLHTHTGYSLLDGMSGVFELAQQAAKDGQPALAVTDHGSMGGAVKLTDACKSEGIKPILGLEAYYAPVSITDKERGPGGKVNYHLTLLATDIDGYHNLIKLHSLAWTDGFYHKPRVDLNLLSRHADGLVVTTGCLGGLFSQLLLQGKERDALKFLGQLKDIFGRGRTFVEVQNHGIADQLKILDSQVAVARRAGLGLLATNDSHYTFQDDYEVHDALLCIGTKAILSDQDRFRFEGTSHYLRSTAEMWDLFPDADFPGACTNTLVVAEMSDLELQTGQYIIPRFPLPSGEVDDDSYLRKLTLQGASELYGDVKGRIPRHVQKQIDYELDVISRLGFSGYFLIYQDLVGFCRKNGIRTGPGRGSAAGCIVAYCTGITTIDPLSYGLFFERFMNPGRKSMPDIDLDFEPSGRDTVYRYLMEKYGEDSVARIANYGIIKGRSALRRSAAVQGYPAAFGGKLASAYPDNIMGGSMPLHLVLEEDKSNIPDGWKRSWEDGSLLREMVASNPDAQEVVDLALGLTGIIQNTGTHASGVIVTPGPVSDYFPVRTNDAGELVTVYTYEDVERMGGLKLDILGLDNLTTISRALELIKETTGRKIDIDREMPLDDPKVFDLLSKADTDGVFQVDGDGMRELLLRMQPTRFTDIVAVIALYRPGPMETGMHHDYADRKNGRQEITAIHSDIVDMFEDTYGLCVTGETLVQNADTGQPFRIDEIESAVSRQSGFFTWGVDAEGSLRRSQVTHWVNTGIKDVLKITTLSGKVIRCSGDHLLLTSSGWKKAEELLPQEDRLATFDYESIEEAPCAHQSYTEVSSVEFDGQEDMYDITVEGVHNFLANELVAHNCIYQEQLMNLAIHYAGFNPTEADDLRKATGKKDADVMASVEERFMKGCLAKGYDKKRVAEPLWQMILPFSGYSFNKCIYGQERVLLPDGSTRSLSELYNHPETREVMSMWPDGEIRPHKIREVVKTGNKPLYQVVTAGGRQIKVTAEHRLLSTRGYQRVENLRVGDELIVRKRSVPSRRCPEARPALPKPIETLRETHDLGPRRGYCSTTIDDIWGVGSYEREMCKWLTEQGILFETHKAIQGTKRTCDFYFHGLYWEMDSMDRSDEFFAEKYGDLPYVVVTPEDFREVISTKLLLDHVENGDPIVRIEYWGDGPTYDIEMAPGGPKNFVMRDGIISHNSHAVSYAMVVYQTAWLKANYPAEFAAACIDTLSDKKVSAQVAACRMRGIQVYAPDINHSGLMATVAGGAIWLGLSGIRNCGGRTVSTIMEERELGGDFSSLRDFIARTPRNKVNAKALASLIQAGCFDRLHGSRKAMHDSLDTLILLAGNSHRGVDESDELFSFDNHEVGMDGFDVDLDGPDWPVSERLEREREMLGYYVSSHPFSAVERLIPGAIKAGEVPKDAVIASSSVGREGEFVTCYGTISDMNQTMTKAGKPMTKFTLEAGPGDSLKCIYFGHPVRGMASGTLVVASGNLKADDGGKIASDDESSDVYEPILMTRTVKVPRLNGDSGDEGSNSGGPKARRSERPTTKRGVERSQRRTIVTTTKKQQASFRFIVRTRRQAEKLAESLRYVGKGDSRLEVFHSGKKLQLAQEGWDMTQREAEDIARRTGASLEIA